MARGRLRHARDDLIFRGRVQTAKGIARLPRLPAVDGVFLAGPGLDRQAGRRAAHLLRRLRRPAGQLGHIHAGRQHHVVAEAHPLGDGRANRRARVSGGQGIGIPGRAVNRLAVARPLPGQILRPFRGGDRPQRLARRGRALDAHARKQRLGGIGAALCGFGGRPFLLLLHPDVHGIARVLLEAIKAGRVLPSRAVEAVFIRIVFPVRGSRHLHKQRGIALDDARDLWRRGRLLANRADLVGQGDIALRRVHVKLHDDKPYRRADVLGGQRVAGLRLVGQVIAVRQHVLAEYLHFDVFVVPVPEVVQFACDPGRVDPDLQRVADHGFADDFDLLHRRHEGIGRHGIRGLGRVERRGFLHARPDLVIVILLQSVKGQRAVLRGLPGGPCVGRVHVGILVFHRVAGIHHRQAVDARLQRGRIGQILVALEGCNGIGRGRRIGGLGLLRLEHAGLDHVPRGGFQPCEFHLSILHPRPFAPLGVLIVGEPPAVFLRGSGIGHPDRRGADRRGRRLGGRVLLRLPDGIVYRVGVRHDVRQGHDGGPVGAPALERIALPGRVDGRIDLLAVCVDDPVVLRLAVHEGHCVIVLPPHRFHLHIVGGHPFGHVGLPPDEVEVFPDRLVGRGDGRVVVLRDRVDRAAAVGVEGDGVGIDGPLGHVYPVLAGHRGQRGGEHLVHAHGLQALPAPEGVALACRIDGPIRNRLAVDAADPVAGGDAVVVHQHDGILDRLPEGGHLQVTVGHGAGQRRADALEDMVLAGHLRFAQISQNEGIGYRRTVGNGELLHAFGALPAEVRHGNAVRVQPPHGVQRPVERVPREGQRLSGRVAARRAGPALEGIALAGGIGEGIGCAAADDGLAAGYAHRRPRGALALGDDHVHRLHLAAAPAVKAQLACDRVLVDVHRRQCDRVVPAARSPRGDGLGIVVRQAVARGVHLAVLLVPPVSEYLAGLLGHIVGHHDGFAGRHTVRHVIVRAAALPFAAIGREHHVRQAQLPIRLEREDVAGIGRAVDGHLFAGLTVSQVDGLVRAPRAALRGPIFQQVAVPRGGADEIHIDLIAHVRQRAAPLGRVQVCPGGRVGIALPGGIRVGRILIPAGVVRAQIQPHHHSLRQGRDRRPGSVRIHVAIARRGDVGDHVVARAGREAIEGQAAPGRGRGRPAGAVVNAVSLARQRRYGQRFTGHRRHLGRGGPIRLDQPCRHIGRVRVRHGGGRRVEHAVQLPALEHAALLRRIDGRGDALAIDVLGHMVRRVLLVVYALRVVGLIDDPVLDGLPYRRHRQVFGGHCLGQGRVPACEFKVFLLRVGRPARYARGQRHSVLHI